MERLTERNERGGAYYKKCFEEPCNGTGEEECDACEHSYAICERLAAYEDLEITPEQVREIDKAYTELCAELGKYKKLEEQGLLLQLPCALGDTVWFIGSKCDRCKEDECYGCPYNLNGDKRNERFLYEMTVEQFRVRNSAIYLVDTDAIFASSEISFNVNRIGKTVFLSKEAAVQALKEMEKSYE